ncbi:Polysaccharide deacetylase [Candidatus Gugararchaeum adminiculabundum]|nr:Polysaccharide deacetylase [Candidatus Gugararchaeum adminiculabundum]
MWANIYKIRPLRALITRAAPGWAYNGFRARAKPMDWNGKKAAVSISFDIDYKDDIPQLKPILSLFDSYKFKASFACVGMWIEKFQREHSALVDHGHELINHTYSHPNNEELNPKKFSSLTSQEKLGEITKCSEICELALGYSPVGFRTPHFGSQHSSEVYSLLTEAGGFTYSSSTLAIATKSAGNPYKETNGIIEMPVASCPRHPFNTLDSFHCFRSSRSKHSPEEFVALFKQTVEDAKARGTLANYYFDPQDFSGKPGRAGLKHLEAILNSLGSQSDLLVGETKRIAEVFASKSKERKVSD